MEQEICVNILVRNHREYIVRCIECVLDQTYKRIALIVMGNGSTDGSMDLVRRHFPHVRLEVNRTNLGYSGGHNKAIGMTDSHYFMPLNPDVFMTPTFVEKKIRAADQDAQIGMVEGKLLGVRLEGDELVPTGLLDSTGLVLTKSRKNYERGHGEPDDGRYGDVEFVFGPFGAAPLYKREMLEDVRIEDEYLDQDMFAYREEVDLAWRAQLRGWKCIYTPQAIAHHIHSYTPESRKRQPRSLRRLQFRNRYLVVFKNDSWRNVLRHALHILGFELLALGYVALREPHLFLGYRDALYLFTKMMKKRRAIQSSKLVTDDYMLQWFV